MRGLTRVLCAVVLLLVTAAVTVPAAVRGPESDAAHALRRVREALDSGASARALQRLARLDQTPLADHAALIRTRLLHQLGRNDDAVSAAQVGLKLDAPRELESLLHQEIAKIEIARGRLLEAYKSGQRAWETTSESERAAQLALELAEAFDAKGLPGDALQLYRRVWSDWPLADVAQRAFERGDALTEATGAPAPPVYALLQRANRLRESFRCPLALDLYERVIVRSAELDSSALEGARTGHAHCLFNARRYPEAVEAFRRLAARASGHEATELGVMAARAQSRAGDESGAMKALALLRKRAGPQDRVQIDFLRALNVRTREPTRYLEYLARVEHQRANPGLAYEARWRLAWEDWLAGNHERAVQRMAPMARGNAFDIEVQRARYWLALAQRQADPSAAQKLLRDLAETQPLSYYGMLAAGHLETRPEVMRPLLGPRPAEPVHTRATRAGWLIDGGFPELARAELVSWLASERLGRAQRLQAGAQLHQVGEHFRAVRVVSDGFAGVLEQGIDPAWREAWELTWPRSFEPQVRDATREFGFDPSLVWAIMREESTYRPAVESPVGAIGLMQLIPPTAERIASELGLEGFAPDKLRAPDLNVRFGTFYLHSLVELFSGSQPLAIAAYNAGPEAVNRWLEHGGANPDDVFVESVPYAETRKYLRRVLRSQRIYRLLYASDVSAP